MTLWKTVSTICIRATSSVGVSTIPSRDKSLLRMVEPFIYNFCQNTVKLHWKSLFRLYKSQYVEKRKKSLLRWLICYHHCIIGSFLINTYKEFNLYPPHKGYHLSSGLNHPQYSDHDTIHDQQLWYMINKLSWQWSMFIIHDQQSFIQWSMFIIHDQQSFI